MSFHIKQNQWGNWNGYEGTKKAIEFGTDERRAKEWLQEKRCKNLVCYSTDIDPLIYNDVTNDFKKEHWLTLALAALDQAGLSKFDAERIQEKLEILLGINQD